MNVVLSGDERTSIAREIRTVSARARRLLVHMAELNDEHAYAYTRGYDWLSKQYEVALEEVKEHLRADFERVGRLVVRAEELEEAILE